MMCIDTPGIGDSEKRDNKHLAEMVRRFGVIGYVHTFVIMMNYEAPRIDDQL